MLQGYNKLFGGIGKGCIGLPAFINFLLRGFKLLLVCGELQASLGNTCFTIGNLRCSIFEFIPGIRELKFGSLLLFEVTRPCAVKLILCLANNHVRALLFLRGAHLGIDAVDHSAHVFLVGIRITRECLCTCHLNIGNRVHIARDRRRCKGKGVVGARSGTKTQKGIVNIHRVNNHTHDGVEPAFKYLIIFTRCRLELYGITQLKATVLEKSFTYCHFI